MSNHLTRTDRALIEKYLAQGYNLSEIAERLSRHVSTISREIKNNRKFLYYDNERGHCINYDAVNSANSVFVMTAPITVLNSFLQSVTSFQNRLMYVPTVLINPAAKRITLTTAQTLHKTHLK